MKKRFISLLVLVFFIALLAYPLLYPPVSAGTLPSENISTDEIVIGATLILVAILVPVLTQIKRWR